MLPMIDVGMNIDIDHVLLGEKGEEEINLEAGVGHIHETIDIEEETIVDVKFIL